MIVFSMKAYCGQKEWQGNWSDLLEVAKKQDFWGYRLDPDHKPNHIFDLSKEPTGPVIYFLDKTHFYLVEKVLPHLLLEVLQETYKCKLFQSVFQGNDFYCDFHLIRSGNCPETISGDEIVPIERALVRILEDKFAKLYFQITNISEALVDNHKYQRISGFCFLTETDFFAHCNELEKKKNMITEI